MSGARSGVAHAMVHPPTATGTLDSGRQRAPPVSRTVARTTPTSLNTNEMRPPPNAPVMTLASGDETRVSVTRGTTAFLEVGPEVVLIAIERVGKRGRAGHPEGVGRVFEPLAVEGSEPGRAKALRRLQVSLVTGAAPRSARRFRSGNSHSRT